MPCLSATRSWFLILALALPLACQRSVAPPPPSPPRVTVALPARATLADYRDYAGRLEAVESVEIRARVQGFLQEIHFKEGTEVEKGQLLYVIDPAPFEAELKKAEAEVRRLEAQLQLAASEARRAIRLRGRAISEEEYTQRIAAEKTAQAALDEARAAAESARLELGYTRVEAPINGRINRTLVTEGNLVGVNEPTLLTTIVRLDPIYVYFEAPERDYLEYQQLLRQHAGLPTAEQQRAPVRVGLENEPNHPHVGTIDFRANRVDSETGTITLRGTLPNSKRILIPGLFARVRVPFGLPRPRLLVPTVAILADQRGRYVLVVGPDNIVLARTIRPGRTEGDWTIVEEGLKADDRVIVNGVQRARAGAAVEPVPQKASEVPPLPSSG